MSTVSSEPKTYPESPIAYGLLQGYQTGDLPAALLFGLIIIQGIQKAGVAENRVNKNLIRIGLVGMGMLAITHLGHMVVGASTGGTIDKTLSVLYGEVVTKLWGKPGAIFFNIALVLAALTTAVGLCGAAGEYFTEATKERLSYKKSSLIMVAISAVVSSVGLDNIVTFIGPLLDACYPAAIVVVLYYVICPKLQNPRLLLGARFAMIAAAVVGFVDVLYTYNSLLKINNAQFIAIYQKLPLSDFRLTWIPVSVLCFLIGTLLYRPKK